MLLKKIPVKHYPIPKGWLNGAQAKGLCERFETQLNPKGVTQFTFFIQFFWSEAKDCKRYLYHCKF